MQISTAETSADMEKQPIDDIPSFQTYHSVLDRHPLLRAASRPDGTLPPAASSSASASGSSSNVSTAPHIDIQALKQVAVLKYLSGDSWQVCPYDFSGECRDKDCENLHLSRLSTLEPDGTFVFNFVQVANLFIVSPPIHVFPPCIYPYPDEEIAQYLCNVIPTGQRYGVDTFRKALDLVRLAHPTLPLDARIQEALSRLGLR